MLCENDLINQENDSVYTWHIGAVVYRDSEYVLPD